MSNRSSWPNELKQAFYLCLSLNVGLKRSALVLGKTRVGVSNEGFGKQVGVQKQKISIAR